MSLVCLAIRLVSLAAIFLHLIAGFLPEQAAWSVWPYAVLPVPLGWLAGLAVASLVLNPVNDTLGRWLGRLARTFSDRDWTGSAGEKSKLWFAGLAGGMAIPFWLFRIRHLLWGDARFIAKALAYTGPDRPIWTIYNWQAPLTIFIHAQLWFLLNPTPGVSVQTIYAITSVLSGVGFVYVLFLLANSLGRDRAEKVTIFGLVITSGSMQLFFGYVENYTIISLGLILTLYLGVRSLRRVIGPIWPSLALAVTNAFHPSTIVLWPAIGYVGWHTARQGSTRNRMIRLAALILPPILVFAGLVALMATGGHGPQAMLVDDRPGGADGIPFVPLFRVTTRWQHYTMFSLAHLLDWANEHFLISPFGLFLIILFLVFRSSPQDSAGSSVAEGRLPAKHQPSESDSSITTFLAIASLAYLILTFVWNPDYGGRRDWDLFAPSAFVYTTLAGYLLVRRLGDPQDSSLSTCTLARVARLLVAASALHTGAWVYFNTIPWPTS